MNDTLTHLDVSYCCLGRGSPDKSINFASLTSWATSSAKIIIVILIVLNVFTIWIGLYLPFRMVFFYYYYYYYYSMSITRVWKVKFFRSYTMDCKTTLLYVILCMLSLFIRVAYIKLPQHVPKLWLVLHIIIYHIWWATSTLLLLTRLFFLGFE
jgi:hypothetical protein